MSKSKDELYIIGVDFKNNRDKYKKILNTKNPSWNDLNESQGFPFKSGEHYRQFIKKRQDRDGTLKKLDIIKSIVADKNNIVRNEKIETESTPNYKESVEIKQDNSQVSDKVIPLSDEELKDVNFILKSHNYNPEAWKLISAKHSIWNINTKVDGIKKLYSSKISVKPRTEILLNEDNITKTLEKLINNYSIPSPKYIKFNPIANGDLLILNIADLHYGLKSYLETSNNEYDDVIATNRFFYVINDVISRIKHKEIDKIILLNLGDICNFDTPYQTTKGTPQNDHSVSYYQMFTKVSDLLIKAIDMLSQIAPVEVWNCNSNHDRYTTFGIFQVLNSWYRNNDNVWIDVGTLDRKYIKYGRVLIGISHDINEKSAFKTIHNEAKEYISDCDYLYWFVAHQHKLMVVDDYGVEIRRLPTISSNSEWSYGQAYTGTVKKSQSFIVSKEYGIIDIMNAVIKD